MAVDPAELSSLMNPRTENFDAVATPDDDYEDDDFTPFLAPADLTLRSTSTINPERPRTWAAGYEYYEDLEYGTMTVVFRDDKPGGVGVWWNYYEIPEEIWLQFKDAQSKGRFLISSDLNNWPSMGPANRAGMSGFKRGTLNAMVAGARSYQKKSDGGQREVYGSIRGGRVVKTTKGNRS